jgi:hypothetical protein
MYNRNFNDKEYKKWRAQVYKRDNHQCLWIGCGVRKKLNAHHIKTWANFPGLRFDVNNGITLCHQHHKLIKGLEHLYEAVFFKILADIKNNNNE